jgi:hypothetical protein
LARELGDGWHAPTTDGTAAHDQPFVIQLLTRGQSWRAADMDKSYSSILSEVETKYPAACRMLRRREFIRGISLWFLARDSLELLLAGLDEFIVQLGRIESRYSDHEQTQQLSFVVARIAEDFEVAIEATISGLYYIANDRMRDVLEINLLLKDFLADKTQIEL